MSKVLKGEKVLTNSYQICHFLETILSFVFLSFLLFPVTQRKSVSSNDSFTFDMDDETVGHSLRVCINRGRHLKNDTYPCDYECKPLSLAVVC